jgi:hypothetical protein
LFGKGFMVESTEKTRIKSIEELSEKLEEWADNPSYDHSPTFIRFAPDLSQKEVILRLLSEKPVLGQKVEEGFKLLQKKVCDLNNLSAKAITEAECNEEFCPRIDEVKGIAYDLVGTLQQIAEEARKERKRRIVKRIFYVTSAVVVFLAALFTILHLLGWLELIKAFIAKMIWHK